MTCGHPSTSGGSPYQSGGRGGAHGDEERWGTRGQLWATNGAFGAIEAAGATEPLSLHFDDEFVNGDPQLFGFHAACQVPTAVVGPRGSVRTCLDPHMQLPTRTGVLLALLLAGPPRKSTFQGIISPSNSPTADPCQRPEKGHLGHGLQGAWGL